jgi:CheY-like chemotaxis protein
MTAEAGSVKKIILVVDDEPQVVGLLKVILEPQYEVIIAKTGSEALAIAQKVGPSLIILDLHLGHSIVTGFETLTMLKSTPPSRDIPVIVLSGNLSPENKAKVTRLGAEVAIEKPYSPAKLLQMIEGLLNGGQSEG